MDYLDRMIDNSDWQVIAHTSNKANAPDLLDLYDIIKDATSTYNQRVEEYTTRLPPSELLPHKNLLIDFYNSPPTSLDRLLQHRRNNHQLNCCPYCGSPSSPNTLDHFIPKDDWPEYSIHPNNLVPQCEDCAPIKGSEYFCTTKNQSHFIHPIYSDIISRIRFEINVIFQHGDNDAVYQPKFFAGELSPQEANRAEEHLKKLKIRDRMKLYCAKETSRLKNLLSENNFDILVAIEQRIREHAHEGSRAKNWKTALYKGIKQNQDFIAHLNSLSPRSINLPHEPVWTEMNF